MGADTASHFVYVVRCRDGSLYTGYTTDVARRVAQHNRGKGARYTSGRRPVELLAAWACADRGAALREEARIKTLGRDAKLALVRRAAAMRPDGKCAIMVARGAR